MTKAVQYDSYGDIDVLDVRDVPCPRPARGEGLVALEAAGINPGEAMVRRGDLHARWPSELPVRVEVFPLSEVRDAYRALDEGHTRGKLILSQP